MVKVDLEDWNCAETGAIGWTLSVLATVAAEIETADLLRDSKSQYCGQNVCKNCKNVCWIVDDNYCNKKKTCPYFSFRSKICKKGRQKWNLRKKLGKEHLDCKKSTLEKSQ